MRSCSLGLAAAMELLGALWAQAEDIQFENLSVEHGLSHPNVRAIVQDRNGFMWFGTEDGLNRHDGYSFTVYKHNPVDSNSLSSSKIMSLLADGDSILWIGTGGGGLNSLDLRTGKFRRHGLNNQYVSSLHIGRDGILWVGAVDLNGFDRESGRMIPFPQESSAIPSLYENVVMAIHEDSDGALWIGTWFTGVHKIEKDRRRVSTLRHDPRNPNSLSKNHVISIFQDSYIWDSEG
jgi:ligand-binding sensor domain-containing protein